MEIPLVLKHPLAGLAGQGAMAGNSGGQRAGSGFAAVLQDTLSGESGSPGRQSAGRAGPVPPEPAGIDPQSGDGPPRPDLSQVPPVELPPPDAAARIAIPLPPVGEAGQFVADPVILRLAVKPFEPPLPLPVIRQALPFAVAAAAVPITGLLPSSAAEPQQQPASAGAETAGPGRQISAVPSADGTAKFLADTTLPERVLPQPAVPASTPETLRRAPFGNIATLENAAAQASPRPEPTGRAGSRQPAPAAPPNVVATPSNPSPGNVSPAIEVETLRLSGGPALSLAERPAPETLPPVPQIRGASPNVREGVAVATPPAGAETATPRMAVAGEPVLAQTPPAIPAPSGTLTPQTSVVRDPIYQPLPPIPGERDRPTPPANAALPQSETTGPAPALSRHRLTTPIQATPAGDAELPTQNTRHTPATNGSLSDNMQEVLARKGDRAGRLPEISPDKAVPGPPVQASSGPAAAKPPAQAGAMTAKPVEPVPNGFLDPPPPPSAQGAPAVPSLSSPALQTANAGPPLPQAADTARVIAPQIVAAVSAQPGTGRIQIQLDPPELGRIDIALEISDQGLRAGLVAERVATGDLIRRHGEILLQHLQDAGFADIDLRFGEGQRDPGRGLQEQQQRGLARHAFPQGTEQEQAGLPPAPVDWRLAAADGLDLKL